MNLTSPKLGLFVKTFKSDLEWLYFGLSSFQRNWNYLPTEIVVVAEPDCEPEISRWKFTQVRTVYVRPWPDGYCHAMAMKMCADHFLPEVDLILLFDSDMVLTKQTSLHHLLVKGMPVLYYDDWHSDLDPMTRVVSKKVWAPAVYRSTGRTLDVDWMVNPLWLFWWSTFAGARGLIEHHTGLPFLQAVYSGHQYDWQAFMNHPVTFCDMQTLGLYANEFEPHLYNIKKRTADMSSPITQYWSHQPIDEVKSQLMTLK